jgi:hypothetical protein
MLLKCYHHLHPLFKNANVDQGVDEDCNLDNFGMTTNTNELAKTFVNKEFLSFRKFQVNTKDVKCCFQWWEKHELMFPIVGFLAQ